MRASMQPLLGIAGLKRRSAVTPFKVMRFLLLMGFMVALLPALGCSGQEQRTPAASSEDQPRYGGVLDMAYVGLSPPTDLDPLLASSGTPMAYIGEAYSGLLQVDPFDPEKIIPDLAERWEVSPDGKVYTFYLRPGVKWSDGAPFTSADVKYTLDRILDLKDSLAPKLARKREELGMLQRVEAVDTLTVKTYLQYPSNSFLQWMKLDYHPVVPKHAYDRIAEAKDITVGTGPFILKEWQRDVVLRYVKNPDFYAKDRPYLDGFNIYMLRDDATAMAALQTGQIKLLREVYPTEIDQILSGLPQAVVTKAASLRWALIGMLYTRPPFNDVRVRRAVHLALDRPTAIQILTPGEKMGGILVPDTMGAIPTEELAKMPGYRADKTQDLAEAKRLLAAAGFPNGFKTVLLVSSALSDYTSLAVVAKDQLAKIGIDATIDVATRGDTRREQSNFDMIAVIPGSRMIDPMGGDTYFGPSNFMKFQDDIFHGLFRKQDQTLDPAERVKLLRQMQDRFHELAPFSVIYWKDHGSVMWPEVRNLKEGVALHNNLNKMEHVWLAK